MKRFLILTTAAAATATAAYAAGPTESLQEPVVQQPVAPADPAPLYDFSGFSLGGQLGYGGVSSDNPDDDGDVFTYGLRSYYDYDLGNTVIGGGLQYDYGTIDFDDGGDEEAGILRVGPRVGYDFGRTMVYGQGGFAKAYAEDDDIGNSNGYYVGIGSETFLTENVTAGAEVTYQQFEDFDDGNFEADATTANVNLNYRF